MRQVVANDPQPATATERVLPDFDMLANMIAPKVDAIVLILLLPALRARDTFFGAIVGELAMGAIAAPRTMKFLHNQALIATVASGRFRIH